MSFLAPNPPQQTIVNQEAPAAPTPAPAFGSQPTGNKPRRKSQQTTFLGTQALPGGGAGGTGTPGGSGGGATLIGGAV